MTSPTLALAVEPEPGPAPQPPAAPDTQDDTPAPAYGWFGRGLLRYEAVFATVAIIVLITRLSGGAFTVDRVGPEQQAAGVTPFTPAPSTPQAPNPPVGPPPASPSSPTLTAFVPPAPAPAPAAPGGPTQPSGPLTPEEQLGDSALFAAVPAPGAPTAISVTTAGDVWVGTDNGADRGSDGPPKVFHLDSAGALQREYQPSGIVGGITALVATGEGPVYLLTRSPTGVMVLHPDTGLTEPYASIPDLRPCVPPVITTDCDGSIADQPPVPAAMAFDDVGNLYIADPGQGAIWRVPPGGGNPEQWLVRTDWANPLRPAGPTGLAFDGAGNLVVVVQGTLTDDAGIIYLIDITGDGQPTEPVELARTDPGALPAGIALGQSGQMYLSLSTAGQVLVLGVDGREVARTPTQTTIDTPAGIAFHGTDLLVTAQTPDDPTGGQVVRLPVGEEGGSVRRA